jgi:anti-sigma factor ChrR (cupin superfamily)
MQSTSDLEQRGPAAAIMLGPTEIGRLPWQPVPGCPGVEEKELWRSGDLVDALIRYAPGAATPGRHHRAGHHHIWVISGAASIAGRHLVAGSYAYIPPNVEHPIHDVGEDGCVVLQMHRPSPASP